MALSDDVDLNYLKLKLKSGEYDGADLMHAWIAIEELAQLRCENLELIAFRNAAFDAHPNIDIDIEHT
jgi:hypothetical protein